MFVFAPTLFAFFATVVATRVSLVGGLVTMMGIGYAYGIVRAQLPGVAGYFMFDAAVLGVFAAWLARPRTRLGGSAARVKFWLVALTAWPALLFLVPLQETAVQLVGLRGSVLFLPLLLIGASLEPEERYRVASWLAVLNLLAFALAVAEYTLGVERFFPEGEATSLILASRDVADFTELRIPSSFYNAHAYAGTMVMTLPWLIGAWVRTEGWSARRQALLLAIGASLLGVFMAAARTYFLLAAVLVLATTMWLRSRILSLGGWSILLAAVSWVVAGQERLQRFVTLEDTELLQERVVGSINARFLDVMTTYPLGNGLGGGGTNIPYFLQERIHGPFIIENDYARVVLEQGVPGLILWLLFIAWLLSREICRGGVPDLGRRLGWLACAGTFLLASVGLGLMASVPYTALLMLTAGWVATGGSIARESPVGARPPEPGTGVDAAAPRAARRPWDRTGRA